MLICLKDMLDLKHTRSEFGSIYQSNGSWGESIQSDWLIRSAVVSDSNLHLFFWETPAPAGWEGQSISSAASCLWAWQTAHRESGNSLDPAIKCDQSPCSCSYFRFIQTDLKKDNRINCQGTISILGVPPCVRMLSTHGRSCLVKRPLQALQQHTGKACWPQQHTRHIGNSWNFGKVHDRLGAAWFTGWGSRTHTV